MTAVADASVAVAYLLGEATAAEREEILGEAHAPSLLDIEVTQTLRRLVRGGALDLKRADLARGELAEVAVRRYSDAALLRRAWELRDICSIYDGLYVALAEALDAVLLTRDGRLARGVGSLVRVLEE